MLGWLKSILGFGWSGIQQLGDWVVQALETVYSVLWLQLTTFVASLYALVSSALNGLEHLAGLVDSFIFSITGTILSTVTNIERWVTSIVGDVWHAIDSVYRFISEQISDVVQRIESAIESITDWTIRNIWDPIWNEISAIISTIAKVANTVYGWIAHPETLVSLLAKYLLDFWLTILKTWASAIGRFIIHSMMGLANELLGVLEMILSAVV